MLNVTVDVNLRSVPVTAPLDVTAPAGRDDEVAVSAGGGEPVLG